MITAVLRPDWWFCAGSLVKTVLGRYQALLLAYPLLRWWVLTAFPRRV